MKNIMHKNTVILALILGLFHFPVFATIIDFTPDHQTVYVGQTVTVDVNVDEINNNLVVAAFDLFIGFDNPLLSLNKVKFGTNLDIWGLGSFQDEYLVSEGLLEVAEVSFDTLDDLLSLQPNGFTLFSMEFTAIAVGMAKVALAEQALLPPPTLSMLVEGNYYPITFTRDFAMIDIQAGDVEEPSNAVSSPNGLALFSLLLLCGFRKFSR